MMHQSQLYEKDEGKCLYDRDSFETLPTLFVLQIISEAPNKLSNPEQRPVLVYH